MLIKYDTKGNPICEICGKSFHRLLAHVRQAHFMSSEEYRELIGLCKSTPIISKDSKEKIRRATLINYHVCINRNLVQKGKETRFVNGHNPPKHRITLERLELLRIARAKARHKPAKEKPKCQDCGTKLTSLTSKRCQKCWLKLHNERNKKCEYSQ